jgi:peptide/nickel transport system permease protein
VVAVVTTVTFILIHLAPGDPIGAMFDDPRVPAAARDRLRHLYGLDQSIGLQYLRFVTGAVRGQFGYSFAFGEPVGSVLARAVPNTLLLAGTALIVSFASGVAMAVVQVARHGTLADRSLGAALLVVYSLPDFWLAQLALLAFAYWLPLFPAGGIVDPVMHPYLSAGAAAWDRLHHLVLPVLTLSALSAAGVARFQRVALLDVAADDYLRTARAKGVSERSILWRHALRNAAVPVITLFGLALPAFLGGAVFVEKVFAWPGLGALAVDSVAARDYPVVVACAVVGSILVAAGSFIADVLYAVVDPRLRRPRAAGSTT